jgi:formylglycine-generating enzyme required for sulfatase activity/Mrp family chromosome partitioning ATPase
VNVPRHPTTRKPIATGRLPGPVVTFYSYKGGVGRSFVLANTAALLARWGWRVLCVDWDLEAPGLHHYFRGQLAERSPRAFLKRDGELLFQAKGLVDLAEAVREGESLRWQHVVLDATSPLLREAKGGPVGALHLLPAGAADLPDYGARVTALDWPTLFAEHRFGNWLEAARSEWVADYDFVLVDSRTGITDAGGVTAVQLPDVLVFVFTANEQSLRGVVRTVQAIRAQQAAVPADRRALQCVPVASRFDGRSEVDLAREWKAKFVAAVKDFLSPWAGDAAPDRVLEVLRVGHFARWSFGEPLPVLQERHFDADNVSHTLANLTALLARGLTGVDELLRSRDQYVVGALAKAADGPGTTARRFEFDLFLSHVQADTDYARRFKQELEARGVRVWLAMDQIPAGESLLRAIDRALGAAEHMVVLWRGEGSAWQWTELSAFFSLTTTDASRRLIPVLLSAEPLPKLLGDLARLDGKQLTAPQLADRVLPLLRPAVAAPPTEPASIDPVASYRRSLAAAHSHLVPFAPEVSELLLHDAVVEVAMELAAHGGHGDFGDDRDLRDERLHAKEPLTLRRLLQAGVAAKGRSTMPRWLVLGEPGSGKTTLARNLVRQLASEPSGPLPIYGSVTRLAEFDGDLASLAAADVLGEADLRARVGAIVQQRLGKLGAVWVLLDGFDEVPDRLRAKAWNMVNQLASKHVHAVLVVLSRPVAFENKQTWQVFRTARVAALDAPRQRELATRLVGESAAFAVLAATARSPRLADLARNPLFLTLLSFVMRDALAAGREIPTDAARLYGAAVSLLLGRGFALDPRPVRDQTAARGLLQALSLALLRQGGDTWSREQLSEVLWEIRRGAGDDLPDAERLDFQLRGTWETNDAFFSDVAFNGGILGPHDGPQERWRYLHRSLCEFLAAERLAALPAGRGAAIYDAWLARARAKRGYEVAPLAEMFQLYLSITNASKDKYEELVMVSAEVALRAVRRTEHLAADERVRFALAGDDKLGKVLEEAVRSHPEPEAVAEILWEHVVPESSVDQLGRIHWALQCVGQPADAQRFFSACERNGQRPELLWKMIPAGEFLMGSTGNERGDRDERPQRRVTVAAFALANTVVTIDQYRRFESTHRTADAPGLPAVAVSWWAARLFCAWLGARLPSEAEWEYACRARCDKAYSFGDDVDLLVDHGWFFRNSGTKVLPKKMEWDAQKVTGAWGCRLRPVGQKKANQWGLFDMHGNVWEWCEDWAGDYGKAPTDGSAQQKDQGSGQRVLRGGSWFDVARICRSAYRFGRRPGDRDGYVGFRPARSLP